MSDRYYFFNALTEMSSWTIPPEFCKLPPLDVNKAVEVVAPPSISTSTNSNNESPGSTRKEKKKSNESLQYPHINPVVCGNDTRRHILPPLNHSTGLVVKFYIVAHIKSPNLKTYFSSSLYKFIWPQTFCIYVSVRNICITPCFLFGHAAYFIYTLTSTFHTRTFNRSKTILEWFHSSFNQ
jgi:hypothetical protein